MQPTQIHCIYSDFQYVSLIHFLSFLMEGYFFITAAITFAFSAGVPDLSVLRVRFILDRIIPFIRFCKGFGGQCLSFRGGKFCHLSPWSTSLVRSCICRVLSGGFLFAVINGRLLSRLFLLLSLNFLLIFSSCNLLAFSCLIAVRCRSGGLS
jgi:hypothetical protein